MSKKGILIVIEGTDCSGKETQSNLLVKKLEEDGIKVYKDSFPKYDTPTGKIVGGAYLGKKHIGEGFFEEGAANVDSLVASAFYVADRRYNIEVITRKLDEGYIVILDRYVESNKAHQGGKIKAKEARFKMYEKLDLLEYEIYELPRPDKVYLLYMPEVYTSELKKSRKEGVDQHESDREHLTNAERAYLELSLKYDYQVINCVNDNQVRTIENINEELYQEVRSYINETRTVRL